MKVVRSSPLRTGRLYPQEFSWYSFLETESTSGHMVPSVATEKISSDDTGDRSRDPPTSNVVSTKYKRIQNKKSPQVKYILSSPKRSDRRCLVGGGGG
jgi:hypothetical protein